MKRTIQCVHKMNISGCAECYPVFLAETDQTPPNTTPLNEEDRLGEILKPLSDNGYHNNSEDSTRSTCYDCKRIETAKQELTKLIQTLEKKAREEAVNYFYWRIDCNTLISELEGWRGCIDNAKDQTERHFSELGERGTSPNNTTTRSKE